VQLERLDRRILRGEAAQRVGVKLRDVLAPVARSIANVLGVSRP
jgi:hypothetical protein